MLKKQIPLANICSVFLFCAFLLTPCVNYCQQIKDSLIFKKNISIYFDTDSFNITPLQADTFISVFSIIKEEGMDRLIIEAHTDSIGSLKYNKRLSERRGQSTYAFLNKIGVHADSMNILGFGELQPLMSNGTEIGRSKNRRVNIGFFISKKLGLLSGRVVSDSTGLPIPAIIVLRSRDFRDSVSTDSNGKFIINTPINEVVVLEVTAKDHFFINKPMKITHGVLKNGIVLKMPRAVSGKKFELESFYFVGNKPELLPKSIPVLHRLYEFMKLNSKICIRIDGHINMPNQAPADQNSWHWKLSDDRTKTVYNFLVENGIDERRIKRKAFANWEMVYPKATSEIFMKKNRRVEILILDCTTE